MSSINQELLDKLESVLDELEQSNDIVICSSNKLSIAKRLQESILEFIPKTSLSTEELYGVRLLVHEAIQDKSFFDWEMPTLTGFTAKQFEEIAEKLPKE